MDTFQITSKRNLAYITGTSILIMAVLAGLVVGMVQTTLIIPGDIDQTIINLQSQSSTFRWGIIGWTGILITDILASWGLKEFYKDKNASLALLTGWFRLAYSGILAVAILQWVMVLILNSGGVDFSEVLVNGNSKELTALFLEGFNRSWSFGLIIFGLHLVVLAYLVWDKKWVLKIISIMILLAGIGYLLTNILNIVLPDYASIKSSVEGIFMLPMVLGEVGLAIWMLFKGGKNYHITA
ncbi:MAG: DUF4386 domain-containing protein [Saprospiraceae bacterium]